MRFWFMVILLGIFQLLNASVPAGDIDFWQEDEHRAEKITSSDDIVIEIKSEDSTKPSDQTDQKTQSGEEATADSSQQQTPAESKEGSEQAEAATLQREDILTFEKEQSKTETKPDSSESKTSDDKNETESVPEANAEVEPEGKAETKNPTAESTNNTATADEQQPEKESITTQPETGESASDKQVTTEPDETTATKTNDDKTSSEETQEPGTVSLLKGKLALCSIDHASGTFELYLGSAQLDGLQAFMNNTSLLQDAEFSKTGGSLLSFSKQTITATKTIGALSASVTFRLIDEKWLAASITVENKSKEPQLVSDLRFISATLPHKNDQSPDDPCRVKLFGQKQGGQANRFGWFQDKQAVQQCRGFAVLQNTLDNTNWLLGWPYPYARPFAISYEPEDGSFSAMLDLSESALVLKPNQKIEFDECILGGVSTPTEGLQAFSELCAQHAGNKVNAHANIISLYTRLQRPLNAPQITLASEDIARLTTDEQKYCDNPQPISHLILAEDWCISDNDWRFKPDLQNDIAEWIKKVSDNNVSLGVKLAPFATISLTDKENGLNKSTITRICKQLRALRKRGVRCFYIQGLLNTMELSPETRNSLCKNPNFLAVLRKSYESIRHAISDKVLLITDEPLPEVTTGFADIQILNPIAPQTWDDVLTHIRNNTARFWMQNESTHICQAELKLDQTELGKVQADGSLSDQARSWCAYLLMSGGPVLWADNSRIASKQIQTLALKAMAHSGNCAGFPLDQFDHTDDIFPARWIRREGKQTYVALFNWSDQEQTLTLDYHDVKELARIQSLTDIFTDAVQPVENGVVSVTLKPQQSFCAQLAR